MGLDAIMVAFGPHYPSLQNRRGFLVEEVRTNHRCEAPVAVMAWSQHPPLPLRLNLKLSLLLTSLPVISLASRRVAGPSCLAVARGSSRDRCVVRLDVYCVCPRRRVGAEARRCSPEEATAGASSRCLILLHLYICSTKNTSIVSSYIYRSFLTSSIHELITKAILGTGRHAHDSVTTCSRAWQRRRSPRPR